ncbi:hypothetical protein [Streptomyces sp. NPDC051014]|uniref:hypothetical protein n=1 Tax=Streptomyces sp. NPDC051014 TaxID=3155751 RepID=UPI0033FF2631
MGYVLIGHGGMEVDPSRTSPDMGTVAIPQGTTIQFYSDSGQGVIFGPSQLDIWQQIQAPWPPLDSSHVTYNLVLSNAEENLASALMNSPQFGGNEVLLPGRHLSDPIHLCSGTPETCPTKPEQVAQGMVHQCDGILGLLQGDLYWLACTSFIGVSAEARPVVEAKLGDRVRNVLLGEDPDATVSEADRQQIDQFNQFAFADADPDDVLSYMLIGPVILIGSGHGISYQNRLLLAYRGDTFQGQMRVVKAGEDGDVPDWFDVYGVPQSKQALVRTAIRRISKSADVVFH